MRRKQKRAINIIELLDVRGKCIYRGPAQAIPMPYSQIAALSDRFFGDPEPCYIHEGAVRARVALELEAQMTQGTVYDMFTDGALAYLSDTGAARAVWIGEDEA